MSLMSFTGSFVLQFFSFFFKGQLGENEGKDAAQPSNRLNTVIERIERLYVVNIRNLTFGRFSYVLH